MKHRTGIRLLARARTPGVRLLIPNLITIMALCCGLTGIRFAIQDQWELAVGAIVVAAILDGFDGQVARLIKGQSRFGAELDSFSDFVCFGVAPAMVLFLWTAHDARGLGWACALFFAICAALRLARFNLTIDNPPMFASRFFIGASAPAAACIGLLPLILNLETDRSAFANPVAVSLWMVLVGLFMVSSIPTYALKGWKLPVILVVGLVATGVLGAPWMTLAGCILIYLATIPLSFLSYRKLTAAVLKGADVNAPAPDKPGERIA